MIPPPFAGLWAEFVAPAAVVEALPLLGSRGLAVNLAWKVTDPAEDARWALVDAAERAGVEVRPWLLLAEEDGYWAGADNAKVFAAAATSLTRAWVARGHAPTTLIVDLEPAHGRVMALETALRRRPPDLRTAWAALRAAPSAARVRSAEGAYRALVDALHRAGWRVHLTTLPFVVDGGGAGGRALRDALGLPVDAADWDVVSLQAYRTLFADAACALLGQRLGGRLYGPHLVQAYGRDGRRHFGDRAGLDLGLVGEGVYPSKLYADPADLAADLAAAAAAGVPADQINVYNLDGVLDRGPSVDWLGAPDGVAAPSRDRATRLTRRAIGAAGRLVARRRG